MTQPSTNLTWIRTRPSKRMTASDAVCDAAEAAIGDGSWGGLSLEDLFRRAGVEDSKVSARIGHKEIVLRLLFDRCITDAAAMVDEMLAPERWKDASISEIIRTVLTFSAQVYHERENLLRAMIVVSAGDDELRERSRTLQRQIGESIRKLILTRRRELLHPAPAIAAEFTSRLVNGFLVDRTLTGESVEGDSIKLSQDQVTTELIHAVLSYLGVFSTEAWDS